MWSERSAKGIISPSSLILGKRSAIRELGPPSRGCGQKVAIGNLTPRPLDGG